MNLAPVDDQAHDKPVATAIDGKLTKLPRAWHLGEPHRAAIITLPPASPGPRANRTASLSALFAQGQDVVYLDRHAKVDLVVPAAATSSSNAIACGAAMVLREAIDQTGYDWKGDPVQTSQHRAALLAIMQKTGVTVVFLPPSSASSVWIWPVHWITCSGRTARLTIESLVLPTMQVQREAMWLNHIASHVDRDENS